MDSINLIDFKEILLAGDIKYLRFVEKNSNRLFLIEDCIDISLEDKIDDLNKLNTIDEVKHYFLSRDNNTNIFEFIFAISQNIVLSSLNLSSSRLLCLFLISTFSIFSIIGIKFFILSKSLSAIVHWTTGFL